MNNVSLRGSGKTKLRCIAQIEMAVQLTGFS
jgi:hypothetical protein